MNVPKVKELSERTKAEMEHGRATLRMRHAKDIFTGKLQAVLGNKPLSGSWRISDKTYMVSDKTRTEMKASQKHVDVGDRYKIFVHIYPNNGELIEIIDDEDNFPSDDLIAHIFLLLM